MLTDEWKVDSRTGFSLKLKKEICKVRLNALREMKIFEKKHFSPSRVASRLAHLFLKDLTRGTTRNVLDVVYRQLNFNKGEVHYLVKICGYFAGLCIAVGMLVYLYVFGRFQSADRKRAWFISAMLWIAIHILVIIPLTICVQHIFIPSLAIPQVRSVFPNLLSNIAAFQSDITNCGVSKFDVATVLCTSTSHSDSFNSGLYFYLSIRLASLNPNLLISKVILEYSTIWPAGSRRHQSGAKGSRPVVCSSVCHTFLTAVLCMPLLLQDTFYRILCTVSFGFLVYVHVYLYNIFPVLVVCPLYVAMMVLLLYCIYNRRKKNKVSSKRERKVVEVKPLDIEKGVCHTAFKNKFTQSVSLHVPTSAISEDVSLQMLQDTRLDNTYTSDVLTQISTNLKNYDRIIVEDILRNAVTVVHERGMDYHIDDDATYFHVMDTIENTLELTSYPVENALDKIDETLGSLVTPEEEALWNLDCVMSTLIRDRNDSVGHLNTMSIDSGGSVTQMSNFEINTGISLDLTSLSDIEKEENMFPNDFNAESFDSTPIVFIDAVRHEGENVDNDFLGDTNPSLLMSEINVSSDAQKSDTQKIENRFIEMIELGRKEMISQISDALLNAKNRHDDEISNLMRKQEDLKRKFAEKQQSLINAQFRSEGSKFHTSQAKAFATSRQQAENDYESELSRVQETHRCLKQEYETSEKDHIKELERINSMVANFEFSKKNMLLEENKSGERYKKILTLGANEMTKEIREVYKKDQNKREKNISDLTFQINTLKESFAHAQQQRTIEKLRLFGGKDHTVIANEYAATRRDAQERHEMELSYVSLKHDQLKRDYDEAEKQYRMELDNLINQEAFSEFPGYDSEGQYQQVLHFGAKELMKQLSEDHAAQRKRRETEMEHLLAKEEQMKAAHVEAQQQRAMDQLRSFGGKDHTMHARQHALAQREAQEQHELELLQVRAEYDRLKQEQEAADLMQKEEVDRVQAEVEFPRHDLSNMHHRVWELGSKMFIARVSESHASAQDQRRREIMDLEAREARIKQSHEDTQQQRAWEQLHAAGSEDRELQAKLFADAERQAHKKYEMEITQVRSELNLRRKGYAAAQTQHDVEVERLKDDSHSMRKVLRQGVMAVTERLTKSHMEAQKRRETEMEHLLAKEEQMNAAHVEAQQQRAMDQLRSFGGKDHTMHARQHALAQREAQEQHELELSQVRAEYDRLKQEREAAELMHKEEIEQVRVNVGMRHKEVLRMGLDAMVSGMSEAHTEAQKRRETEMEHLLAKEEQMKAAHVEAQQQRAMDQLRSFGGKDHTMHARQHALAQREAQEQHELELSQVRAEYDRLKQEQEAAELNHKCELEKVNAAAGFRDMEREECRMKLEQLGWKALKIEELCQTHADSQMRLKNDMQALIAKTEQIKQSHTEAQQELAMEQLRQFGGQNRLDLAHEYEDALRQAQEEYDLELSRLQEQHTILDEEYQVAERKYEEELENVNTIANFSDQDLHQKYATMLHLGIEALVKRLSDEYVTSQKRRETEMEHLLAKEEQMNAAHVEAQQQRAMDQLRSFGGKDHTMHARQHALAQCEAQEQHELELSQVRAEYDRLKQEQEAAELMHKEEIEQARVNVGMRHKEVLRMGLDAMVSGMSEAHTEAQKRRETEMEHLLSKEEQMKAAHVEAQQQRAMDQLRSFGGKDHTMHARQHALAQREAQEQHELELSQARAEYDRLKQVQEAAELNHKCELEKVNAAAGFRDMEREECRMKLEQLGWKALKIEELCQTHADSQMRLKNDMQALIAKTEQIKQSHTEAQQELAMEQLRQFGGQNRLDLAHEYEGALRQAQEEYDLELSRLQEQHTILDEEYQVAERKYEEELEKVHTASDLEHCQIEEYHLKIFHLGSEAMSENLIKKHVEDQNKREIVLSELLAKREDLKRSHTEAQHQHVMQQLRCIGEKGCGMTPDESTVTQLESQKQYDLELLQIKSDHSRLKLEYEAAEAEYDVELKKVRENIKKRRKDVLILGAEILVKQLSEVHDSVQRQREAKLAKLLDDSHKLKEAHIELQQQRTVDQLRSFSGSDLTMHANAFAEEQRKLQEQYELDLSALTTAHDQLRLEQEAAELQHEESLQIIQLAIEYQQEELVDYRRQILRLGGKAMIEEVKKSHEKYCQPLAEKLLSLENQIEELNKRHVETLLQQEAEQNRSFGGKRRPSQAKAHASAQSKTQEQYEFNLSNLETKCEEVRQKLEIIQQQQGLESMRVQAEIDYHLQVYSPQANLRFSSHFSRDYATQSKTAQKLERKEKLLAAADNMLSLLRSQEKNQGDLMQQNEVDIVPIFSVWYDDVVDELNSGSSQKH